MSNEKPPKNRTDYQRDYQRDMRAKKVTVSFLTDPDIKDDMKQMASDHGFSSIKAFMEDLTRKYNVIRAEEVGKSDDESKE